MTRRDAWTDAELTVIYGFVNRVIDAHAMADLLTLLPRRSAATIRNRICQIREEAGIGSPRARSIHGWDEKRAAIGSRLLGEAIERELGR